MVLFLPSSHGDFRFTFDPIVVTMLVCHKLLTRLTQDAAKL